jgi:hypothetical protein
VRPAVPAQRPERPRPFPRFTEEREVSEEVRKEQIATEGLPPAAS